MNLVTLSFSLALAICVSGCRAEVDNEAPDLSRFKLRRIDAAQSARQRASQLIDDLGVGAKYLHDSLFTDSLYVSCPAYAHLFRLIESQNKLISRGGVPVVPIRQDVVEMLAVVVTSDRMIYHRLLRKNTARAAEQFVEVARRLETTPSDRDTWLELVRCMKVYMTGEPTVTQYLNLPQRAHLLRNLVNFKALPVNCDKAVTSDRPPHRLVAGLAKKFEAGRPRQASDLSSLEDRVQREAGRVIESLDDEETAEERGKLSTEVEPMIETELEAPEVEVTKPETSASEVEIEIVLPNNDLKKAEESSSNDRALDFIKLNSLKLIKFRIEQYDETKNVRVPMQLAYDFFVRWNDLLEVELDLDTSFDRDLEVFLHSPENKALAERVYKAISDYIKIGDLIEEMQLKQESSERAREKAGRSSGFGRSWANMDEFRSFYGKLSELVEQMDPAFNIDDLRRIYSIWRKRYTEYDTLDKFIHQW